LSGLRFDLGLELAYGMRFRADSDAKPIFNRAARLKERAKSKLENELN
jgi:hypothetical protein